VSDQKAEISNLKYTPVQSINPFTKLTAAKFRLLKQRVLNLPGPYRWSLPAGYIVTRNVADSKQPTHKLSAVVLSVAGLVWPAVVRSVFSRNGKTTVTCVCVCVCVCMCVCVMYPRHRTYKKCRKFRHTFHSNMQQTMTHILARSQNCEKRLSALSCPSVRLSAWHNSAPTGRIIMKSDIGGFF